MGSPAYYQDTRHPDSARGGQTILHTHLFTTPRLGQCRKRWLNIVSTLDQCLVFAVVTVHAVDSVLTRTTCALRKAIHYTPLCYKAYPALALVAVKCSFTARVAATIKAYW